MISYQYLLEKDQEYEIWYLYHQFEQFYANRPDYYAYPSKRSPEWDCFECFDGRDLGLTTSAKVII